MAVAYATLGREFLALMLRVVIVRTVVTPAERQKPKTSTDPSKTELEIFFFKATFTASSIHFKKKSQTGRTVQS